MAKYRTKPFEVEAVQWLGNNLADIKEFGARTVNMDDGLCVYDFLQDTWVLVNLYDFVIKGMKGEYYPCDPDVFNAKYELIS